MLGIVSYEHYSVDHYLFSFVFSFHSCLSSVIYSLKKIIQPFHVKTISSIFLYV